MKAQSCDDSWRCNLKVAHSTWSYHGDFFPGLLGCECWIVWLVLNCLVRAVNHCGQVIKGVWGMSWRQKAMKGVEGCEKLGGVVKRTLIPRFPNYGMLNT